MAVFFTDEDTCHSLRFDAIIRDQGRRPFLGILAYHVSSTAQIWVQSGGRFFSRIKQNLYKKCRLYRVQIVDGQTPGQWCTF